jgi:hypothetical protein
MISNDEFKETIHGHIIGFEARNEKLEDIKTYLRIIDRFSINEISAIGIVPYFSAPIEMCHERIFCLYQMLLAEKQKLEDLRWQVESELYSQNVKEAIDLQLLSSLEQAESNYEDKKAICLAALTSGSSYDKIDALIAPFKEKVEKEKTAVPVQLEMEYTMIYGKGCYELSGESRDDSSSVIAFVEDLLQIELNASFPRSIPHELVTELAHGLYDGTIGDFYGVRYEDIELNIDLTVDEIINYISAYRISEEDFGSIEGSNLDRFLEM